MPPVPTLRPADTHAVVVGVGHYNGSDLEDLDGAVEDALKFVDWLVTTRRVPPRNIQLFLSPTTRNIRPAPGGIKVKPATRENLDWVIDTYLKGQPGSLLWFFWAGHGVQQRDGSLRLLYENATAENKRNLDLNGLIRYLRTDAFRAEHWAHQVFIVDACRNFASHERWYFELPTDEFAIGEEVASRAQFALFAAREGESAWESATGNLSSAAISSGVLTHELLGLLKETPADEWPPNLPTLTNTLIERFKQMCQQGRAKQVPSFISDQDWDGNRRTYRSARHARVPVRTTLNEESRGMLVKTLQGIDQFASHGWRADLIAALRVQQVPWAQDPAEHAAVVIDACSEVDWGFAALLDALDARKSPGVEDLAECLDRCCWLSVGKWIDLVVLMRLIARGLDLSHQNAATAIRRCAGLQPPPSAGEELFFRAIASFAKKVRQDDRSPPPLFAYLEHCKDFFPPDALVEEFNTWEEARARELKVDLGGIREEIDRFKSQRARTEPARAAGGAVLCIKVEPRQAVPPEEIALVAPGSGKVEGHRVTAWLRAEWVDGGVKQVASRWPVPGPELVSVLAETVVEGYSWVEASADPGQAFRVDVFLPMALLDLAVDRGPLEGREDTLGDQYHIVARSYDRFYDTKRFQPARKALREYWPRCQEALPDNAVAWLCPPEESDLIVTKTTLTLIGLRLPAPGEQGSREQLLAKFLQSGLPCGVFLRGSRGKNDAMKRAITDLVLAEPPARWSTKVLDFRAADSLASLQCDGLTLLWDDPNCVPPDVNYKLKTI